MKHNFFYKSFLLFLLVLQTTTVFCQYQYKAKVPDISLKGYYRIALKPEISSKCQSNFEDLRIQDEKGNNIPYLLNYPGISENIAGNFLPISIIDSVETRQISTWILDRNTNRKTSELTLKINNADVNKTGSLQGSDDLKKWFIIKSFFEFNPLFQSGDSVKEFTLQIPPVNYRYFKFSLNDTLNEKVNILKFGIYINQKPTAKIKDFIVPPPLMVQKDSPSVKTSTIIITMKQPFIVNKMVVAIAKDFDYDREIELQWINIREQSYSKHSIRGSFSSLELENKIDLENVFTDKLKLIIYNKDNQPLTVTNIELFQKPAFAILPLNPDSKYTASFGNNTITAPDFDISSYYDKTKTDLPLIELTDILNLNPDQKKKPEPTTNYKIFIWLGIAVVLIVLVFITLNMLKELKKQS